MSDLYYVNCIDSNENVFVVSKIKHGKPYVEVNLKDCEKITKGGKRKTQKRKSNK